MNAGNLDTTNLLLGIMAAVSVLEALILIGLGVIGYRLYAQTMTTVQEIEARQVAPLVARVNALVTRVDDILADVKDFTTRANARSERVSQRVNRVVSFVQTARAAVDNLIHFGHGNHREEQHNGGQL